MQVGVTKVLLCEDEIGVQSDRRAKFIDRVFPIVLKCVGIAQIIVRAGFRGRLSDRVGPKLEPILVEQASLVGEEAEYDD